MAPKAKAKKKKKTKEELEEERRQAEEAARLAEQGELFASLRLLYTEFFGLEALNLNIFDGHARVQGSRATLSNVSPMGLRVSQKRRVTWLANCMQNASG